MTTREAEIPELNRLSTAEIAALYDRERVNMGVLATRMNGSYSMLAADKQILPDLLRRVRVGLNNERQKAIDRRDALDRALPRKRIADTIGRIRNELDELEVTEAVLLGTHEPSDEPLHALLRKHLVGTTPEEDLYHSWLSLTRAYGDPMPGEVNDAIADKIQERFDKLQEDKGRLTDRVLGYESIFQEWPIPPEIPDDTKTHFDITEDVVRMTDKPLVNQKPAKHSLNRNGERREIGEAVSQKIIAFLIENRGTFFTYDEIAETVYDNKLPEGRRDNRIGTIFHNNLHNVNQENVFTRLLGEEWVLVRGQRIPLDPDTGKPPKKYKPRVCYKVISREEAEQAA